MQSVKISQNWQVFIIGNTDRPTKTITLSTSYLTINIVKEYKMYLWCCQCLRVKVLAVLFRWCAHHIVSNHEGSQDFTSQTALTSRWHFCYLERCSGVLWTVSFPPQCHNDKYAPMADQHQLKKLDDCEMTFKVNMESREKEAELLEDMFSCVHHLER